MSKRVQLVRDDNAGSQLFLGKDGEITVNTGNKSIHVHDAINKGGTEQARADLNNVSVATSGNAGKMSAQQAAELAQALLDIVTNTTNITSNDVEIAANIVDITALQNTRANKVIPAATNNIATLAADGDLQDSGDLLSDYFKLAGGGINIMLFQQTAAPVGWTKIITHNDKALRIVSGAVGSGGADSFSTVFAKTTTDNYTLLEADVPAHDHGAVGNHTHVDNVASSVTGVGGQKVSGTANNNGTDWATSAAGAHTHTSFGGGGAHSHGLANFNLQYVDFIIASKD